MVQDEKRPEDLCYYGNAGRVFVYRTATGWTERETSKMLRELQPLDPVVTFNWGYIGSGANQVAQAILGDALSGKAPMFLYQAFTADFVSQFPDEFRLRQGAVLRWVRGFLCDRGEHGYPAFLPPVDPYNAAYRLRRLDPESS
jgi:hypothetical protein